MNDMSDTFKTNKRLIIKTTTDVVANIIRQRIVTGELKPNTKINIEKVARELNVSPTPVREAIRTLQAERLVRIDPHRGASVKGIETEELIEIYELLRFLEVYAVKRAVNNYLDTDIQKLSELLRKMRDDKILYLGFDYWNLHIEFLRVLTSYGEDSQWVRTFLELLWQNAERYRGLFSDEVKAKEPIHHYHEDLFKAAKNRDGKLLVDLIEKHLVENQNMVMRSLQNSEKGS